MFKSQIPISTDFAVSEGAVTYYLVLVKEKAIKYIRKWRKLRQTVVATFSAVDLFLRAVYMSFGLGRYQVGPTTPIDFRLMAFSSSGRTVRAAALFEMNAVTRTVHVGETFNRKHSSNLDFFQFFTSS